MKRMIGLCAMVAVIAAGTTSVSAQSMGAANPSVYNFGDFRSSTLTGKAWQALNEKNLDGVLAYTNKNIELYSENAKTMQAGLKDYPAGSEQEIFAMWALNDIATSLFIQGEAYRKAGQIDKAKEAYNRVVNEFSFGQCWDPAQKIFWKPAEAAKDKLDMIEKGLDLDFGDMSSSFMIRQAWGAMEVKNYPAVHEYVKKVLQLYEEKAKTMQASLKEIPWESKEKIFSYWALNDVGTGLFQDGEAYRLEGNKAEAIKAYKRVMNEFAFAQCWDPQGWFWKPAEAAMQKLAELDALTDK